MEEKNNIVIYQLEDGKTKIDVKLEDETVWLSQQQMAELFSTSRTNIIEHIPFLLAWSQEKDFNRFFLLKLISFLKKEKLMSTLSIIIFLLWKVHTLYVVLIATI